MGIILELCKEKKCALIFCEIIVIPIIKPFLSVPSGSGSGARTSYAAFCTNTGEAER